MSTITELPDLRALSAYLIERRRANLADQEDWLAGIEAGVWTCLDLFEEALSSSGAGLGSLRLRRLLRAMGIGKARTTELLSMLSWHCASARGATRSEPDVAWLVDRRANGRRVAAWCDVILTPRATPKGAPIPPWPGFPLAPPPDGRAPLCSATSAPPAEPVPVSEVEADQPARPEADPVEPDEDDPWAVLGHRATPVLEPAPERDDPWAVLDRSGR